MGNSSSSDGSNTNTSGPNERRSSSNGRPSLTSRGLSHRITGGGSNNNAGGSSSGFSLSLPSPFRTGGSLGLSKAELDARCQPSGLYPTCEWETKQIRRLISNGHLAARSKGYDGRMTKTDRECPICFMYYNETNVSKCCNATLCTECYLQIKPQKDKHTTCPFCNNPKMTISVQRGMDEGDVAKREEEEQKVIEATIMSRLSNLNGEHPIPDDGGEGGGTDGSQHTAVSDGGLSFGSSLENYNRNRARTFSNTSSSGRSTGSGGEGIPGTPPPTRSRIMSEGSDASVIQSLAMSPDDRRALESEMREQLSHETHRRMESEAEEARSRHTQEWYESNAGMRSRVREARLAELTGLLERMSRSAGNNEDDEGESSLMAAAVNEGLGGGASLSRLLRAMEAASVSGGSSRNNTLEELMRLEAAFFVGNNESGPRGRRNQSLRSAARNSRRSSGSGDNDDSGEAARSGNFGLGVRPASSIGGGSSSSRRLARRGLASNRGGMSSTHLDTAELLMRGVSEEEQLAMAIAMSMQEQQTSSTEQAEEDGGGNNQEGEETDQLDALQQPPLGDEEDSLSSESSSSSSDDSADEETNTNNDDNDRGEHNDEENDNSNDAVSLDENEEEVVFTDGA